MFIVVCIFVVGDKASSGHFKYVSTSSLGANHRLKLDKDVEIDHLR